MMTDVDAAIRDVTNADDWLDVALVGALLAATTALVVPGILLAGYTIRVLRDDADGPIPGFDDVEALAADGFRASGVLVAYHAPVVVAAGVGSALAGMVPAVDALPVRGMANPAFVFEYVLDPLSALPLVGIVVGVTALVPFCSYLSTVALTRYARLGDVGAAFDVATVWATATDATTIRHWLTAAFVGFAGILVAAAVGVLPAVGTFVGAFVTFYGGTASLLLWRRQRRRTLPDASNATPDTARA
ncbi:MAG: DUF4013 domain-containing protein [Haloferacaceae archaeon]